MSTVTVNGNTYSSAGESANDMRSGGHRTHLLPMLSDAVVDLAAKVAAAAASAAQVVGMGWNFSTTTSMADPGSGIVRFNHATISNVTAIALDDNNAAAADMSAYILTWDDSTGANKGTLTVRQSTTIFAVFNVTGITDNVGWTQLAVTHIASIGTFADTTLTLVDFNRAGDAGGGIADQAIGFIATGGTTPKTLTVDADITVSDIISGAYGSAPAGAYQITYSLYGGL